MNRRGPDDWTDEEWADFHEDFRYKTGGPVYRFWMRRRRRKEGRPPIPVPPQ